MATMKINRAVETHWITGIRAVQMLGEFNPTPKDDGTVSFEAMCDAARSDLGLSNAYPIQCIGWGEAPKDNGSYSVGRALLVEREEHFHEPPVIWLIPNEFFAYLMSDAGATIDRL